MHTRLRGLIAKSFTPRVIEALRPNVVRIVERQLELLGRRDRFDLIADFAYPIPALVIAGMFGAPVESRPIFEKCSESIVSFVGTGWPDVDRASRANESLAAFADLLEPLFTSRRQRPREDLLSLLVASQNGDALSSDELLAACVVILFAGHETTANLLGNGVLALLSDHGQLELLQREPDRSPRAVEELLRYDAPVQRVRRVVLRDCELGGRNIEARQLVMAFLGSANRDPDRFVDPDRLDITRERSPHVAFGHGIHTCIGAALTRLEAPVAITRLLERFPAIQILEQPRFKPNITFRGLKSLLMATGRNGNQNGAA
jgi:cytochrome P450